MLVAYVVDPDRFMIAVAITSQREIATAKAMRWMRWAVAAGVVRRMLIRMGYAMTLTNAWARSMPAVFATGRELFTIVVALQCQRVIAIAMATCWTRQVNAEDRAPKMRTTTAFVMMWMRALEASMLWGCATVRALQMRTTMASVMMQTTALE
jgi:hypothetical protein